MAQTNMTRSLAIARLAVGGSAWATPRLAGRAFGLDAVANPQTPRQEVGPHTVALRGKTVNLYSDLLVHHMGQGLADGITQGAAGPDEFRTAPLWGLGERVFFLHDGRTSNLLAAVQAHASSSSRRSRSGITFS